MVDAGAGAGKTAVLVQRYLNLLQSGVPVSSILALTFTKKAASEMQTRVYTQLLSETEASKKNKWAADALQSFYKANITTIHGFCSSVLTQFSSKARLSDTMDILDPVLQGHLWEKALIQTLSRLEKRQDSRLGFYLKAFSWTQLETDLKECFSKKDSVIKIMPQFLNNDSTSFIESVTQTIFSIFNEVLASYDALKSEYGVLDYSDLIDKTQTLLREHPDVLNAVSTQFQAILVDEFQDTDKAQWDILCQISHFSDSSGELKKNLFLVGDPKQAIYGFRGAETHLFTATKSIWGKLLNTISVDLSENYRTLPGLLAFFNPFFERCFKDSQLHFFPLQANRHALPASITFGCSSSKTDGFDEEMRQILVWIKALIAKNPDITYSDIAILFRRKKHMERLKTFLMENQIHAHMEPEFMAADQRHWSLFNLCACLLNIESEFYFTGFRYSVYAQSFSKERLQDKIRQWQKKAALNPLYWMLEFCLKDLGYVISDCEKDFIKTVEYAEISGKFTSEELLSYLRFFVQMPVEKEKPRQQNSIRLMTIHSSKGLEFKAVIILESALKWNFSQSDRLVITHRGAGLSYTIQNQQQNKVREEILAQHKADCIEEEKRLFYVACTRASDHLFFSGLLQPTSEIEEPKSFSDLIFQQGNTDLASTRMMFSFPDGPQSYPVINDTVDVMMLE